ncbi:TIR domain-containing protein [Ponticoccus gilvus]|nr:TIR domain-containing protein [Enemella evansiae]
MKVFLEDVFKKSGTPTHTFVEPVDFSKLVVSLRAPGRSAVVEGPSGIGKTTAIKNALERTGKNDTFVKYSARKATEREAVAKLLESEFSGSYIFDDFHKFDAEIQRKIADVVKVCADEERDDLDIVIVGINDCGKRLISFADDVTNRVDFFRMEVNPLEKMAELITKGETALNIKIDSKDQIATASGGSFYLAQMLCYELCAKANVLESREKQETIDISFEQVKSGVWRDLSNRFKDRTITFCKGPKFQASGRAPYHHVLFWLAEQNEWTLSIRDMLQKHSQMRGSVGQVVQKNYLRDHIENNSDISAVLHFDPDNTRLTLEDPQFAFYIREMPWNHFTKEVGFKNVTFKTRYDFALSFSGTSRAIAERIFEGLQEFQFEVFYDRQEEQRMLAQDIEEYLEPIYRSEAKYVLCIIDDEYSKKMWPRFEVTKFEERLGDGAVIPILIGNFKDHVFSKIEKVGHFRIKNEKPEAEVKELVELLAQKMLEADS